MLRSALRVSSFAAAAVVTEALWTVSSENRSNRCVQTAFCASDKQTNEGTFVGLYLSPVSRRRLQQYLDKSFSEGNRKFVAPASVVVHASAPPDALEACEPVFGTAGAMRIKGIVITDSTAAAMGSVSTFFGPLDGLHFEASIPISGAYSYGAVLPSALAELGLTVNSKDDKAKTAATGVFTSKEGLAAKFQGEKYSYIPLPEELQLRLRGIICSVDRIQPDGSCKCDDLREKLDRQMIAQKMDAENKREEAEAEAEVSLGKSTQPLKAECPLCVFIKGGPCVEEFKVWDGCLKENMEKKAESEEDESDELEGNDYSACLDSMKVMMACMMKHEYYDVFTSQGEDDVDEVMREREQATSEQEIEADAQRSPEK